MCNISKIHAIRILFALGEQKPFVEYLVLKPSISILVMLGILALSQAWANWIDLSSIKPIFEQFKILTYFDPKHVSSTFKLVEPEYQR